MTTTLICPNSSICSIYKMYVDNKGRYIDQDAIAKLDVIRKDKDNYYCSILKVFNIGAIQEKKVKVLKFPAECALVELLNNSIKPNIVYRDSGGGIK